MINETATTITINNITYTLVDRPWWMDSAYAMPDGRIIVARANATNGERRFSQAQLDADPTLNPYYTSTENEGELAGYMIGLTDADLVNLPTPGIFNGRTIVDGPRPVKNNGIATCTNDDLQKMYQSLYNEGYDESEDRDNTPYQKGDNYPE
jgi:hypothetical protein